MFLRVKKRFGVGGFSGFTLIELLVVIAIIAILASIILIQLNSARVSARDSKRIGDLQNVATAMELYANKNGNYPTSGCGAGGLGAGCFNSIITSLNGAGLISSASVRDPLGTSSYTYEADVNSSGVSYILGANLEQDNTACASDYDGANITNTSTTCADGGTGTNRCGGDETDHIDYCIKQAAQ